MKVSFDLDDTLILSDKSSIYESKLHFPLSLIYRERLRKGIKSLCHELNSLGYKICVYTTSNRDVDYIRRWFYFYGIKLCTIINLKVHENVVQRGKKEIMPSKLPSRFGIDLHIDDDISVKQNGVQYGFNVFIIDKFDEEWDKKVLSEAKRIKNLKKYYNKND